MDGVFAVGRKERCYRFRDGLDRIRVLIDNLGGLRWYAGCHYCPDKVMGLLTIFQRALAETTATPFGVTAGSNTQASTGELLCALDVDESDGDWRFRALVGSLIWLAN